MTEALMKVAEVDRDRTGEVALRADVVPKEGALRADVAPEEVALVAIAGWATGAAPAAKLRGDSEEAATGAGTKEVVVAKTAARAGGARAMTAHREETEEVIAAKTGRTIP